jgi:hypothetical protein
MQLFALESANSIAKTSLVYCKCVASYRMYVLRWMSGNRTHGTYSSTALSIVCLKLSSTTFCLLPAVNVDDASAHP